MTRNGEPIELVPVRDVIATGIEMDALLPGLVPFYEEREAARFGNYSWRAWRELEPPERAEGVAHYRLYHVIQQHQADAVNTAMERRRAQQR